jgi:hypothetical protein
MDELLPLLAIVATFATRRLQKLGKPGDLPEQIDTIFPRDKGGLSETLF